MDIPLLYPYIHTVIYSASADISQTTLFSTLSYSNSWFLSPPFPSCFSLISGGGTASRSAISPCLQGTLTSHSRDLSPLSYLFPLSWIPHPTRVHCIASSLGQFSITSHWTLAVDFPRAFTPYFYPLQHSLHTSAKDICVRYRCDHLIPFFSAHPFPSTHLMPKQGCCGKGHSPQCGTQQGHQGPGSFSSFHLCQQCLLLWRHAR